MAVSPYRWSFPVAVVPRGGLANRFSAGETARPQIWTQSVRSVLEEISIYDVENRWIGEDIDSNGDGQIDHLTRFVYDGNQIVLEFDRDLPSTSGGGAGGEGSSSQGEGLTVADLSHRYLWQANAVDQLLADEQLSPLAPAEGEGYDLSQSGMTVWALTDQLGTVRDLAVYGSASGVTSVVNHRVYDSYGNLKSQTNAAVDCLFGFTGRPMDSNTGLRNHLNRWSDPRTGDWMSEDPIGFTARGTNTRCYCGNSPTNHADPTGLAPDDSRGWNASEVLNLLKQISPKLGAFWQQHGKIEGGAQERAWYGRMFHWFDAPSVKVTRWMDNKNVMVDPSVYPGMPEEVTAYVPDEWTSLQVANFIAGTVASDPDLEQAIANSAGSSGFNLEMNAIAGRAAAWATACRNIAATLETTAKVAVSLIPGGIAAIIVSDLSEGAFGAALLDAIPLLPAEKIGAVALRFVFKGGKEIEVGAPTVKVLYEMTDAEKATLKAALVRKTAQEAEAIIAKIPKGEWVAESTAGWSSRAVAYQEQITGRSAGQAFKVNGIRFDTFNGVSLVDAKGPGYAKLLDYGLGEAKLLKEATNQVIAALGVPVTWYVAEQDAAAAISKLLGKSGDSRIRSIKVVFAPPAT